MVQQSICGNPSQNTATAVLLTAVDTFGDHHLRVVKTLLHPSEQRITMLTFQLYFYRKII